MSKYPDIYVLRHGQTEWNLAGRYQGRRDSPLTELGEKQAVLQGKILKRLDFGDADVGTFCSTQGRAIATAALALAPIGATATKDARLQEIGFGSWESLTRAEIDARWSGVTSAELGKDWYFEAPDGESYDEISGRVEDFLDDLTSPAILVTHGITSIVLRGLWLGMSQKALLQLSHEQGCVYHMTCGREHVLTTR